MSVAIDPAEILERVAFRLHLPTFASGQFVTADQALLLLQDACQRLTSLLLNAYGANYFAKQATLATQAGVDIVSLPAGLAQVESAYWVGSDGRAVQLERAYRLDEDLTARSWSDPDVHGYGRDTKPAYRLEGNVLVLRPVPSDVYTLRIDYQDTPTIAAVSDTIYGQAGWADWLVWDLMAQVLDREDKALRPDQLIRWQKCEADIRAQAAQRDRGARPQAIRVYESRQRNRFDWRCR